MNSDSVRLSEEQRLDWLRLIRTDNVGPRGIMAQTPQEFCGVNTYLPVQVPAPEMDMPHAKILTIQATHTLEQLHAELGGKILDNKAEAKRLAAAMVHVEAVLKMLQPGYDVRPIAVRRRKPNPWFKRGTVFRTALDVLRAAERPLTTREITEAVLAVKGVMNAPDKAMRDLEGAVRSSLQNHKNSVTKAIDNGTPTRWSLLQKP